MFNLKLDIDEESEINEDFFDNLPFELQYIIDDIRNKSNQNKCPVLNNNASGAFGTIEISKGNVKKILNLVPEKKLQILLNEYKIKGKKSQLYFLLNRLNNYCNEIKSFVRIAKSYFPYNFLDIYKCNLCKSNDNKNLVYVEMALGKGDTLSKIIKNKNITNKEIYSIFIQIYYISLTLNLKKLYHNDLKPANIIIIKSTNKIKYDLLNDKKKKIEMILPKNSYYPVIIDYDLVSKNESHTSDAPSGAFISPLSPDFSFFSSTVEKINSKYCKFLKNLPVYDTKNEILNNLDNIYKIINNNKVLSIKIKNI